MKKVYSAPEILFESFTMSTNIAGDCEAPFVNNATKGTCAVLGTGNVAIFDNAVTQCTDYPADWNQPPDCWNGLCYHVPTDTSNLFNS